MSSNVYTKIGNDHDSNDWNNFVNNHSNSIFHEWNWLKAIENFSGYEFVPLLTYIGEKLTGIFPLFLKKKFGVKILLSPPPKFAISNLGPLNIAYSNKRNKNENQYHKILNSQIRFLKQVVKFDYLNFLNQVNKEDIRPYLWNNYSVNPLYTYFINLDLNEDELFKNLDGRIRTAIRKVSKEKGFDIIENNKSLYFSIIDGVRSRYKEQGLNYPLSNEYLDWIYNEYGDKGIFVKGIQKGDRVITGLILLTKKDYVGHWIGGVNNRKENMNGLNELLHWETIKEYSKKNFKYYELIGGNTEHLAIHKSRYNCELKLYFELKSSNLKGELSSKLYRKFFN